MENKKPESRKGKQKIFISVTLRKRGITEEEILKLESKGLLKEHGIFKSAGSRYCQYIWFKDTGQQKL